MMIMNMSSISKVYFLLFLCFARSSLPKALIHAILYAGFNNLNPSHSRSSKLISSILLVLRIHFQRLGHFLQYATEQIFQLIYTVRFVPVSD